jgi:hypothetical protein
MQFDILSRLGTSVISLTFTVLMPLSAGAVIYAAWIGKPKTFDREMYWTVFVVLGVVSTLLMLFAVRMRVDMRSWQYPLQLLTFAIGGSLFGAAAGCLVGIFAFGAGAKTRVANSNPGSTSPMNARQAKDFLVEQAVQQAALDHVPLSDIEKRMMYFTETDDSCPEDFIDLNNAFEAECDTEAYEKKMTRLLADAHLRIKRDDPEKLRQWNEALRALKQGDHYILILCR